VKPSPPPTIPVRDVAVKKEVASPVKVYAPSTRQGEAGGAGGGDGHHVRIIETSGAVVLGRPTPSRTASSSAGLRATSHTSRSFIWPANIGSTSPQLLFPTYRLERPTGSGKRIDAVVATLTPSQ
jgi:hypothetical protein